ncbi:MAG: PAS domain S-box protein [Spirochaetales bacterium]|nr:PAS domain S-box protein [Spirochaetales bacterium]
MEGNKEKARILQNLPSIDDIKNESALLFALDKDDHIVFADKGFISFLEKNEEEITGHYIEEFLHQYLLGNLAKEEITFIEFVENYNKSHVDLDFMPAKTGERKTLHCEFRIDNEFKKIGWELVVIGRRAAQFKQLETLLEIIQETSKTLLASSFDMTIRLDADKKVTSVNAMCEKQMGCTKTELAGKDISFFIAKERDKETIVKAFDQAAAFHNVYNIKINIKLKNKIVPALVNVTAIRDSFNNDMGYALVMRNIEEETKMGSVLKRLEAIDKMNALGELALGISHQTKNYINSISTGLLLLENDISGGFEGPANYSHGALSHLAVVKNNLAKLTWLTKHLLSFAPINTPPIDSLGNVNDVLTSIYNLVVDTVRKHKAEIIMDLSDTVPAFCFSPIHLEQAFLNIVNNAIDALPPQGGRISIRSYMNPEKDTVCINIEDNGTGIPEEILHKIFDIFETTKPVGKGTGLGLYVANHVVSLLKGSIDVESSPAKGSTFIIKLPLPQTKRYEKNDFTGK